MLRDDYTTITHPVFIPSSPLPRPSMSHNLVSTLRPHYIPKSKCHHPSLPHSESGTRCSLDTTVLLFYYEKLQGVKVSKVHVV